MSKQEEREQYISGILGLSELPSPNEKTPFFNEMDEVIDMGEDFDFEGYQVVRREFFAHMRDPSITFKDCKIYVNNACLKKFPSTDYVQILINQETKIMALRPCIEGENDSYQWCYESKGKRKPKQVSCSLFFAKIFTLMGWNPDYRYKLLGHVIHSNGTYLLAFDLTATEVYQRVLTDNKKYKSSRTPMFPSEWQNQFGLSYTEHQQSMQINVFDGYAVYAIKENAVNKKGQHKTANGDGTEISETIGDETVVRQ